MRIIGEVGVSHSGATLKQILIHTLGESATSAQLSVLVYFARSIAESYFLHFRSSVLQLCQEYGLSTTDLALDCIAEIFARNADGRFTNLQHFASSLDVPIVETPPDNLLEAFRSMVIRFANAQLARSYAQIDPAGAKIHRNLRDHLRQSTQLKLSEDFRGYVIEPRKADLLNSRPPFPLEPFMHRVHEELDRSFTFPRFLTTLHREMVSQHRYRRSVILFEVVQMLKTQFAEAGVRESEEGVVIDETIGLDLATLRHDIQKIIQQKIISTYFLTGKLTREDARVLNDVLTRVMADIIENGAPQKPFQDYVMEFRTLSLHEYETHWRAKVEYLSKIGREALATWLTKNL